MGVCEGGGGGEEDTHERDGGRERGREGMLDFSVEVT